VRRLVGALPAAARRRDLNGRFKSNLTGRNPTQLPQVAADQSADKAAHSEKLKTEVYLQLDPAVPSLTPATTAKTKVITRSSTKNDS
jgi:hypothetical protein